MGLARFLHVIRHIGLLHIIIKPKFVFFKLAAQMFCCFSKAVQSAN